MKTWNTTKFVAAIVFCAATTGFANDALAYNWAINIDCHGDNGNPGWASSQGPITVEVKINNVWTQLGSYEGLICNVEDAFYFGSWSFSWQDVAQLRISNSGNDMFWIDQVFLRDSNQTVRWSAGIDNNFGYCLSAETEDPSAYCWNGRSYRSLTWTL